MANAKFINLLCESHDFSYFGMTNEELDTSLSEEKFGLKTSDVDKVRTVFKQLVRDWSAEGASERQQCYDPVIKECCRLFPELRHEKSILVPGAGLGRLAWEIAKNGFNCQGNEWSLHMLIPSYFMINVCDKAQEHEIFPWITKHANVFSRDHQLSSVLIPDVDPSSVRESMGQFSMAAGDFLDIYDEPSWDCVATVFFLDTAHNVIEYLEKIHEILKPGGYWINLGPLLYHFADMPGEISIELSYEEVRQIAEKIGFKLIAEERSIPCTYTQDPNSMLKYVYSCTFSTWQKISDETGA